MACTINHVSVSFTQCQSLSLCLSLRNRGEGRGVSIRRQRERGRGDRKAKRRGGGGGCYKIVKKAEIALSSLTVITAPLPCCKFTLRLYNCSKLKLKVCDLLLY